MTVLHRAQPARAQDLDGRWESEGYGLLIEIDDTTLRTFQTTAISCIPWWTARRIDRRRDGEIAFDRGDAEITVKPGTSADRLILREGTSIGSMTFRRAGTRPATCATPLPDTPENNYAVFWQTFAEEFALFSRYDTDWDAVDRLYRPQVTSTTSPEALFDILRSMILPFHNAHTNINAGSIHRQYLGYRPASTIGRRLNDSTSRSIDQILALFSERGRRAREVIESHYASGPLRPLANGVLHFGWLADSVAYLGIDAFEGFAADGTTEENARALEAALDLVFREAGGAPGLVIDVRTNIGGADPFCLAIAARLTDRRYLAYSKVVRTNRKGPLRFSRPLSVWVEPSSRPGFRGRVVLLQGPDTISGGETFAMALMGRVPRVVRVGENTQGVFSDVWGRRLPNGWTFGVPSELYLGRTGQSFDRSGVPPDIRAPVYREADLASGRDPALERARMVALGNR